jgi:hypothetical protein
MSEFKIDNLKVLGPAVFGDKANQANIGGSDNLSQREDLVDLISDLERLRVQMQAHRSTERGHHGDIEAVAVAEDAAKEGNRHAALGLCRRSEAGSWI